MVVDHNWSNCAVNLPSKEDPDGFFHLPTIYLFKKYMGKIISIHFRSVNLLGYQEMPLFLVEERHIDINSIVMEMYFLLLKILYACKISLLSHSSLLKHWGSSQAKTLRNMSGGFEWMGTHSASVILCGWLYCCENFQSENSNLSIGAV